MDENKTWVTIEDDVPRIADKLFIDKDRELHAYTGQAENYFTITDCISNKSYEIYYLTGSILESSAGITPSMVNSILSKVSKYNNT